MAANSLGIGLLCFLLLGDVLQDQVSLIHQVHGVKQPRYEVEHLIYPLSSLVSFLLLCRALKAHRFLTDFPQVAELGGTFGLFVGFSFLGVFDVLVDISCSAKNILFKQRW